MTVAELQELPVDQELLDYVNSRLLRIQDCLAMPSGTPIIIDNATREGDVLWLLYHAQDNPEFVSMGRVGV